MPLAHVRSQPPSTPVRPPSVLSTLNSKPVREPLIKCRVRRPGTKKKLLYQLSYGPESPVGLEPATCSPLLHSSHATRVISASNVPTAHGSDIAATGPSNILLDIFVFNHIILWTSCRRSCRTSASRRTWHARCKAVSTWRTSACFRAFAGDSCPAQTPQTHTAHPRMRSPRNTLWLSTRRLGA